MAGAAAVVVGAWAYGGPSSGATGCGSWSGLSRVRRRRPRPAQRSRRSLRSPRPLSGLESCPRPGRRTVGRSRLGSEGRGRRQRPGRSGRRRTSRPRLVRQKHQHPAVRAGFLVPPRLGCHRCPAPARRPGGRRVRQLPSLPRLLAPQALSSPRACSTPASAWPGCCKPPVSSPSSTGHPSRGGSTVATTARRCAPPTGWRPVWLLALTARKAERVRRGSECRFAGAAVGQRPVIARSVRPLVHTATGSPLPATKRADRARERRRRFSARSRGDLGPLPRRPRRPPSCSCDLGGGQSRPPGPGVEQARTPR